MADYNFSGDVDIEQITLIGGDGSIYNIQEMFIEVNIYQSLFKKYLECDILVSDALNIGASIKGNPDEGIPDGFRGIESIIISYRERTDPSQDAEIPYKRHLFGVYEVASRRRDGEGVEGYILSGISVEAYRTLPQKISKSYGRGKGNKISKMMESLMNEYVLNIELQNEYQSIGLNKTITIDETSGVHKYIIPNYSVDKTIDFFCRKADSDDHYPYYVFYEDSNGFNFRNIPNLISDGYIDWTYTYYPQSYQTDNRDVEGSDQYKILSFKMIQENNFLENVKGGMFKSRTVGIDIQRKKKTEKVFNYTKEHDKFTTFEGGYYPVEVEADAILNVQHTKFGQDADPFFNNDRMVIPKRDISIKNRKQSYNKQIFNNIIQVTIPGDSTKNVGQLIDLQFYIYNDIQDSKYEVDKSISGEYLITKVRQTMNDEKLTTILECCKDSPIIA